MKKTIKADRIVTVHSKTRVRIHFMHGQSKVATTSIGAKKWAKFCYQELLKTGHDGAASE
jgi:hypothetical protein